MKKLIILLLAMCFVTLTHAGAEIIGLKGDFDLDGDVDGDDMSVFAENFGKIELPPPTENGVWYTHYNDEFFGGISSEEAVSVVDQTGNWLYDSLEYEGYLTVPQTGSYEIRIRFFPRGELIFNSVQIGEGLGTAGWCWPTSNDSGTRTTALMELTENTYYPFRIRTRTGCDLYTSWVKLEWKHLDDPGFTLIPAQNLFLP